jgi:hypothetical protein
VREDRATPLFFKPINYIREQKSNRNILCKLP